ncbi:MAG: TldD/PmbA family protein, partial [Gemmatimonadota bacterium]|nr:TldD/PmbA family protein [Gemmatimonadota bacterium]
MTQKRRDFLKAMSAVAVANGAIGKGFNPETLFGGLAKAAAPSVGDPLFRELAMVGLEAARSAGAEYADVRISNRNDQGIFTREAR